MQNIIDAIFSDKKVVVITGAGISTLSGISDFRGKNGLYSKNIDAEIKLSKSYFLEEPQGFYDFYTKNMIVNNRKPNIVHETLAKLEEKGYIEYIITQNIDGLHEKSGSKRILNLHGNGEKFYCCKCKKNYTVEEYLEKSYVCSNCNGVIRPDIVLYGESIKSSDKLLASQKLNEADVLVVLGSSLVVSTVASLLKEYIKDKAINGRDKSLFIINEQNTPFDCYAYKYSEDLGKVLKKLKIIMYDRTQK